MHQCLRLYKTASRARAKRGERIKLAFHKNHAGREVTPQAIQADRQTALPWRSSLLLLVPSSLEPASRVRAGAPPALHTRALTLLWQINCTRPPPAPFPAGRGAQPGGPFCTRGGREELSWELREQPSLGRRLHGNNAHRNRCLRHAADARVQKASLPPTVTPSSQQRMAQRVSATATEAEGGPRLLQHRPVTAGQPAPSREVANLLWFAKSCARQFQRLPFSRQALHRVILRNPHLRLICGTKNIIS